MARKGNQIFLDGRFDFQSPALAFRKARLYADRLELSGWRQASSWKMQIEAQQVQLEKLAPTSERRES